MRLPRRTFTLAFLLTVLPWLSGISGASDSGHSHEHHHGQQEVSSYPLLPHVDLEVTRDAVAGWNLFLKTENFRFAPEQVNEQPVPGVGHAHLYVDGIKFSRLYAPWFHLGDLDPGRHELRVTLNANNHALLVLRGEPLAAILEIDQ